MNGFELKEGEVIDRLGYQGLQIIQHPRKFKFTVDAFLLAGLVTPSVNQRIIDLGSGGGILPLLLAGQDRVERVDGIEIQAELADMSRRSVLLNRLENRIQIIEGDFRRFSRETKLNSYDLVISNPPFFPVTKGSPSPNDVLAQAKFEICCTLADLIKTITRLVKGNGKAALVYPAERLDELFNQLNNAHLTPKRVCLVHPRSECPGRLALVEARPGAKSGLQILPPLFIYNQDGEFSKKMNLIFRGGKI